jgi:hypothetical protein
MGGKGLEGNSLTADAVSGSVNLPECSAAKSAALPLETADSDPALQLVVERWATLPDEARARILAVVREARRG